MTRLQKLKVFSLKVLGATAMFGLSTYLLFQNFYRPEVSAKVELGFTFLIGMAIVFFIILRMVLKSKKKKDIAAEVARTLGEPNQGTSPAALEILTAVLWILPILMLAWLIFLMGFYTTSIYMVLLYIAGSLTLGFGFRIFAIELEQIYLIEAKKLQEDKFIARIKS